MTLDNKLTLSEIEKRAREMPVEQAVEWLNSLKHSRGSSVDKLADIYIRKLQKINEERKRLKEMSRYEIVARSSGFVNIAGIDEAGRGPLAGPVVAACVMLPEDLVIDGLDDSKKLTASMRDKLFDIIVEKAVAYGIGMVQHDEIDRINILNATKKAMMIAVSNLSVKPDYLIIDAVELPLPIRQLSVCKADSLSVSVAAASIIAKVTRDRWMERIHKEYPQYGFDQHKGYGTQLHINAIKEYGLCPIHRRSFTGKLVDDAL
ncbi:MAG TPA: ribonuclease HII [Clostridia bacterium]